jgi:ubiquinone/menaquinone biosynthesis C-methylase UbiE
MRTSVLELGSGGGNNAFHYKHWVPNVKHWVPNVTLTDPSPGMLALSRTINAECEHVGGDMRTLRLGRAFDAVPRPK